MVSDFNLTAQTQRVLRLVSPDFPTSTFLDGGFIRRGVLPTKRGFLVTSPRFKIPSGLIDRDLYDIVAMGFDIRFGQDLEFRFDLPSANLPEVNIIAKAAEITNVTTSVGFQNSISACQPIEYSFTYDNVVSNATLLDDERYIIRFCIEDTTNDIYLSCTNILFEPDSGTGNIANISQLVPYSIDDGEIESEVDTWIYEYTETGNLGDCPNCGGLIDFFTADSSAFNIISNQSQACKYQSSLISGDDKTLQLLEKQANSLGDIADKTGTFKLELFCPPEGDIGSQISCAINAQVEDSQTVEKEVDFTCYIEDSESNRFSSINFNQMITREFFTVNKQLQVPQDFVDNQENTIKTRKKMDRIEKRQKQEQKLESLAHAVLATKGTLQRYILEWYIVEQNRYDWLYGLNEWSRRRHQVDIK